ncbi:acetolactate synthase large subunit [Aestuariivirga litoralis]|uniref:Acetolactate synthase large subunit n=1 Tax=Aestuariivirga litoralis TaxID=2650924 RepID=A0A2W2B0S1_9HYPH|nr:acetolactate synthase large subunit [Aestuariivirga litoralis]PZF78510.1 acetolactate synthase large subunit [Aestuariivirga litoralis]
MNGAQSLFKALVDAGLTTCFANPGTSEMQLVYEIGRNDKVRAVLCLQEDVVTGAADGYGRMTGMPAFTLLHVASGFANGIAMLHNAGRANTPLVNVVGANASYHQPNFPEHELINGRITDFTRVVSHWSAEARSASELGELGAQAAALAKTGKLCTIVAPTNRHWDEANPPPAMPEAQGLPRVAGEAVATAAAMLKNGRKTGLVLGNRALHGAALETAAEIAAATGASLLAETFASRYLARGAGRPVIETIPYEFEMGVKFLSGFEQLVFVGAAFPVATFAYRNKPMYKTPADCALFTMASVSEDMDDALARLSQELAAAGAKVPRNGRAAGEAPKGALTAGSIGQSLALLMPENAILVDEAATNGMAIIEATKQAAPHDYLNPLNGGAIGGGLPMALGAAIACPARKVVHLQADGSGMYTVQALWSMARERADVVIVLLKNDAYSILDLELARVRDGAANSRMMALTSLGDPTLDWVSIATGLGVPASRASSAEDFHARFKAALGSKGPQLIECQLPITAEWRALEDYVQKNR